MFIELFKTHKITQYVCVFIFIVFLHCPKFGHADSPPFFEIKGDKLFYSLDGHAVVGRGSVTVTFGTVAIAGNDLKLNVRSDVMNISGNVVVVSQRGGILTGRELIINCKLMLALFDNVKLIQIQENVIIERADAPEKSTFHARFLTLKDLKDTNIYVETPKLHYFPDRIVRAWKCILFFEHQEAGKIPYLTRKIGKLPSPGGFSLKNLGFRSGLGIDLAIGYNYLLNDSNYGFVTVGGKRLNYSDNDHEPIGIASFEHTTKWKNNQSIVRSDIRTDDEQIYQFFYNHFSTKYNFNSEFLYSQMPEDRDLDILELQQQLSWRQKKSHLELKTKTDLETELITFLGYREQIVNNLKGELTLQYFSNKGQNDTKDFSRTQGELSLNWSPRLFYTGLNYSREYYFPESFANEETLLTFHLKPIQTSDGLLIFNIYNSFSLKRIERDKTRELISDLSNLSIETEEIILSPRNSMALRYGLNHIWEKDLPQVTFFDVGGTWNCELHKAFNTGLRYSFITRRESESPWLIYGYQDQIGSLFGLLQTEKLFQMSFSMDYDLEINELIAGTIRSIIVINPYLYGEIQSEYNFTYDDWVRADIMLVRNLHFAELRAAWRQVSETFYIEYVAKL